MGRKDPPEDGEAADPMPSPCVSPSINRAGCMHNIQCTFVIQEHPLELQSSVSHQINFGTKSCEERRSLQYMSLSVSLSR